METAKRLQTGLTLRGDHYYCPLALQLNTYFNCENECVHCYLRRLNRTWGKDLRPLHTPSLFQQVENGLKNNNPKSPLAAAIKFKKTIYVGSKSDPYQPAELEYMVTRKSLAFLLKKGYSVVIATKYTDNLSRDISMLSNYKDQVTLMPIITPGYTADWELLEKRGTTNPVNRIESAAKWSQMGFHVGINGEPFIPGFHTEDQFYKMLLILKEHGLKSYNTYNLHMNDWNAKAMNSIGLDIEKIWIQNQDREWKKIQKRLIEIAEKEDIILGCPDFVNSGKYVWGTNTCCGINVPNPCRFNLITWKYLKDRGFSDKVIIESTWDGVGDKEYGLKLLRGEIKGLYTLKDITQEDSCLV